MTRTFLYGKYSQALFTRLQQFSSCRFQCQSYDERTELQHSLKLTAPEVTACCGIKCKCSTQHGHESQIWQILQHLTIKIWHNTFGPEVRNSFLLQFSFKICTILEMTLWLEHVTLRSTPFFTIPIVQPQKKCLTSPLKQFPLPDFRRKRNNSLT